MTTTTRRLLTGMAAVALAVTIPSPSGAEQDCTDPTVNTLLSAEAAVSRPAIASPAEYPVSNVYAQIEQATKPQFVYAEAGPQYAGAFEALLPAGSPTPNRAVSAYPSEDIPDEDSADWGGYSHTAVTPISASASSKGSPGQDFGGARSDSSRAWVTSTVECDVITIVAGWSASNVVFGPGASAQQMGERLTLVVSPQGSSSDVEVTLVGVEGAEPIGLEGRPADPFTDPMVENGGPRIEAGEPRAESGPDGAWASGGGFNLLFTDPETGQGAGYRIGSINAKIEVLGTLDPAAAVGTGVISPPRVRSESATSADAPAVAAPTRTPGSVTRSVTGNPPPPSTTALIIERTELTDAVFSAVTVTTRSWFPLFLFGALVMLTAASGGAAHLARSRFPTLDWLFGKTDTGSRRFSAVYLKW